MPFYNIKDKIVQAAFNVQHGDSVRLSQQFHSTVQQQQALVKSLLIDRYAFLVHQSLYLNMYLVPLNVLP